MNNQGLTNKYEVYKTEDGNKVHDCFVLRPETDKIALEALKTYTFNTTNQTLRDALSNWIMKIETKDWNKSAILSNRRCKCGSPIYTYGWLGETCEKCFVCGYSFTNF